MQFKKLPILKKLSRDVSISFINISTGDNELEGNIKFIGQLKSSPSPPDDKPEPGFGKRVRELRKYIHTQTIDSRYEPKVLFLSPTDNNIPF